MSVNEMSVFSIGGANEAFEPYFIGQSYLNMLSDRADRDRQCNL